jgi:hypothetical protein
MNMNIPLGRTVLYSNPEKFSLFLDANLFTLYGQISTYSANIQTLRNVHEIRQSRDIWLHLWKKGRGILKIKADQHVSHTFLTENVDLMPIAHAL